MPKFDNDRSSPQPPPVRPPTLPLDFPDIPQKPGSELQPPPDPSAAQDHVAETTSASDKPGEADMTKDEWRRKNVRLREKIREVLEQHPELRDATDEIAGHAGAGRGDGAFDGLRRKPRKYRAILRTSDLRIAGTGERDR
jgi:hypothetical protein